MTNSDIVLYTTEDGQAQFVLRELSGQLWLTQLEIAELYQTTKQNISKHIKAILDEGELSEKASKQCQISCKMSKYLQKSLAILVMGEHNVPNNTHNASDLSVPVWVFL